MVAGWRHLSLLELVCPITPWSRAGCPPGLASVSPGRHGAPRCAVGGLGTVTSPHRRVVSTMERGWDLLSDAPPASAPQPSVATGSRIWWGGRGKSHGEAGKRMRVRLRRRRWEGGGQGTATPMTGRKLIPASDVHPAPASPAGDQERCQQHPPQEGFSGKCLWSPPETPPCANLPAPGNVLAGPPSPTTSTDKSHRSPFPRN